MTIEKDALRYICDWRDENGDVCGHEQTFSGDDHGDAARKAGWGAFSNTTIRRAYWGRGARVWFCPTHATVFGNNHGWGGLESYDPPIPAAKRRWWWFR